MADMEMLNPFTPSFGEVPLILAGRDRVLRETSAAFRRPSRSPELTMLISGARGTGKTTLLAKIAEDAELCGWIAVKTVASPGMLEDIYQHALRDASHLVDPAGNERHLTGIGIGQLVSLEWTTENGEPGNWRIRMEAIIDQIENAGSGLLIAVDEVDPSIDEMIQLASVYQLMVMDNRKVALLMAGLPHNIEKAKDDRRISFVRRAQQRKLARLEDFDVAHAIDETVKRGGRSIAPDALDIAVDAAGGFPFMIQLVGYRMWEAASDECVSAEAAREGAQEAARELDSYVLDSTYRDLSDGDIAFLAAMLEDDGPSLLKDIGTRLGKPSGHVGTYRERLLKAGVIDEPDRNMVDFSLPGFRRFLKRKLNNGGSVLRTIG